MGMINMDTGHTLVDYHIAWVIRDIHPWMHGLENQTMDGSGCIEG